MKKVSLHRIIILTLALSLCLPVMAFSWSTGQIWYESGYQFDKIEIFMQDDTLLTAPVMTDIPQSGWESILVNSKYNLITGPRTDYIGLFNFQLPDPDTTARTFDYLVYDMDVLQYGQTITLGGGRQDYPYFTNADGVTGSNGNLYDRSQNSPVPLPGAVLLLGAGLVRLAAYARRRQE